ncbi:MAG TPA: hypothetical protein VI547_00790 [Anaerolineales bacterium]|nr:hypothetical protein [Anaerolineales bacterium]
MTQTASTRKPIVDWLTVIAIAAITVSLNVAFHEGIHAIACTALGGDLQEYSALHVACENTEVWRAKVEAGSASIANLILGTMLWLGLRNARKQSSAFQFFLWLFMLMNWLAGAGYWMFSGVANIGDWAVVIEGWEPHGLWRVVMTIVGTAVFAFCIWLALRELGQIIGGEAPEQIQRASRLGLLSYFTAAVVVALAGSFNPYGFFGLPSMAGIFAILGAQSPLLWMMQWFRAKQFVKAAKEPLEIARNWTVIAGAVITVFVYAVVLGRTLYF